MALSGETLDLVLATLRAPTRAFRLRERALPGDVLGVIRLAAGEEGALAEAAAASGLDAATLRESAAFFLQQALFHPEADAYRVLGAWPAIDDALLKQHYRWLMHWLHPDRAANPDWSVFADRVSRAWNTLRTPDRRARYDAEHGVPKLGEGEPVRVLVTPRVDFAEAVATPWLSGRAIRRLPGIVIGSLLLLALAGIALVLHIERSQPEGTAWTAAVHEAPREAAAVAGAQPSAPAPPAADPLPAPVAAAPSAKAASSAAPSSLPPPAAAPSPTATPVADSVAAPAPAAGPAVTSAPPGAAGASLPASADVAAMPALDAVMPRPAAAATLPVVPPRAAAAAPPPPAAKPPPATPTPATPTAPAVAAAQPSRSVVGAPAAAEDAGGTDAAPPALASAAPPGTAPEAARPTPAQKAERTLQAMSEAYRRGDLEALMALFDSGARSELGDREAIARDYRRLFASSRGRNLTLSNLTWLVDGSRATAFGNYEAVIVPRDGGSAQVVRGSLRVDVLLDADRPRILRLLHDGRAVR